VVLALFPISLSCSTNEQSTPSVPDRDIIKLSETLEMNDDGVLLSVCQQVWSPTHYRTHRQYAIVNIYSRYSCLLLACQSLYYNASGVESPYHFMFSMEPEPELWYQSIKIYS